MNKFTWRKEASYDVEAEEYPKEMLDGLNNLREQEQLCDIIINVGGKSFPAHKAVLAATGDYFLAMFTSGFRESSENKIMIEGSAEAFEVLLEFAYTGRVEIYQVGPCIYEVLEMACYTQLTTFTEICSSAIEEVLRDDLFGSMLCVSDVCKVMLLAEKHSMEGLQETALKYLESSVEGLKSLDVFLEYTSISLLQDFLSRDNLSSEDDEKHVLEMVINWLKHNWEERKKDSYQLLQKVRLGLVTSEDIKELVGQDILDIPECLELVNRVLDVQATNKSREVLSIENPEIAATRSTITAPILSHEGKFEFYAEEHNDWIALDKFATLPSETAKYSMVVVDNILYAVGGEEGTKFYSYQAGTNEWLQLPALANHQFSTKLVSLGGYIYAVGILRDAHVRGIVLDGPGLLIERYDISEEKWEPVEPPPGNQQERDGYSDMSSLDFKQAISVLVFEGKMLVSSTRGLCESDEYDENPTYYMLEEFMMYDPESNNWHLTVIGQVELGDVTIDYYYRDPVLFIYNDQLYRFMDKYREHNRHIGSTHSKEASCVVLTSQDDGTLTVTMEQDNSLSVLEKVPSATLSGIVIKHPEIEDRLFDIHMGVVCIFETDIHAYGKSRKNIVLEPDNLHLFPKFSTRNVTSTPIWFTFDRKKLSNDYYSYISVNDPLFETLY